MRVIRLIVWIVGVASLGLLSGCATRGRVTRLDRELATAVTQLEEIRKFNESIARELARAAAELKALEAGTSHLARQEQETTQQLSRAGVRLTEAERSIHELRTSVADLSREGSRPVAHPSPPEPAPRQETQRREAPEKLYAAAQANMRAREHGQAVLDFLDFIAKYPKHPLASNAQYWIGEAYYIQRDFRQALIEFEKVVTQYGKSNSVADAIFRIGLCYKAIHEPRRAQEAWDKLIEEFPESDAARKARTFRQARPAAASARPR